MTGTANNRPQYLEPEEAYALWAAGYPAHAHNPFMLAEERAMLSLLPQDLTGQRVLDAGCGTGRYLIHAARRNAAQLIGVDLSPQMLARAREELAIERYQERALLVRGRLERLPVRSEGCSLTLCSLVAGHIQFLDTLLMELYRVTSVYGIILCSDVHPLGEELGWKREFKSGGVRHSVRHTWHSIERWETLSHRNGLEVEVVLEPRLALTDIPPGAVFDPNGLNVPVALVLKLRKRPPVFPSCSKSEVSQP
jgi:malonyl-CoA O-methyltransferase